MKTGARDDALDGFVWSMERFLKEARAARPSTADGGETEEQVLGALDGAFGAALAARGSTPGPTIEEARRERGTLEDAVLAEIGAEIGGQEIPAPFRARFKQDENGWFDLFVRDGADRLKTDEAFRTIWQSQKLASIAGEVARIVEILRWMLEAIGRTERKLDAFQDIAQRRHDEMMAAVGALAVARENGVPEESLRPILGQLGHTDVSLAQIPSVLGAAVGALIERSREKTRIHNDGPAIDEAIRAAREKLAAADTAGALEVLAEALAEDDAYERASQAEQEARAHRLAMGQARARAYFEQAFVQRTTFDHAGAIESLTAALKLDGDDPWRWFELGDELRLFSRLAEAASAYAAGGDAARRTGDQRYLAMSLSRIGEVQVAQGHLDRALKSLLDGLAIFKARAASDLEDAQRRRDLSVSFEKIGDVQVAQGRLDEALKSFLDGLAIREALAASDRSNTEWRRDISVSLNKIGDVQVAQGLLDGALASYRGGLAIVEELTASDPDNVEWRRDLSVSFNRIGDVQVAQARLTDAMTSYSDGLAIAESLTASDPGNAQWRRDHSVSFDRIGDVHVAQGSLDEALTSYRAGLAIREALAASDSGNAEWRRNLAVSFSKIGDVHFAQGRLDDAVTNYRADLAIAETLAASDRGNAQWQHDLAVSHSKLANAYRGQDNAAASLSALYAGRAIMMELAALSPGNAVWRDDLASFDREIAELCE
ncbi:hypothetical protein [Methylopila sp. M107]|uniref:tetratricopeptide repeat protein n=1 Tax=Methylopila sp. M107 TaxID=1101190 RepID=UPI0012DF2D1D|nr:hypothetical protein [Methylopila sp. M107]